MSTDLRGLRVLVTRPAAQAAEACAAITLAGGEAVSLPLIDIGPDHGNSALQAAIQRLDDFKLGFFVSPNAVTHGVAAVRAARGSWPAAVQVACVGPGSRQALQDEGFLRVISPEQGFDSEAVLALPAFSTDAVHGREVLIFRGDGGRELLADTLRERGALVSCVSCYHRSQPVYPAEFLAAAFAGLGAISLTASEGVQNLCRIAGDALEGILTVPVFCSHPRIAASARGAGFRTVFECAPGNDGLVAALRAFVAGARPGSGSAAPARLG